MKNRCIGAERLFEFVSVQKMFSVSLGVSQSLEISTSQLVSEVDIQFVDLWVIRISSNLCA